MPTELYGLQDAQQMYVTQPVTLFYDIHVAVSPVDDLVADVESRRHLHGIRCGPFLTFP